MRDRAASCSDKNEHRGSAMQSTSAIERQTMKKVYLRLLPFCFILYFICYLDRVNIGFAALTMNKDLGLSAYIYGLGAGAFFWGYFLLEVPSNLILEKIGARRWIGRIMITWGIISGAFIHPRTDQLLHTTFYSRSRRSWIFSRYDTLFHVLVSALALGADRGWVHGGGPDVNRPRLTSLDC